MGSSSLAFRVYPTKPPQTHIKAICNSKMIYAEAIIWGILNQVSVPGSAFMGTGVQGLGMRLRFQHARLGLQVGG